MPVEGGQFRRTLSRRSRPDGGKVINFYDNTSLYLFAWILISGELNLTLYTTSDFQAWRATIATAAEKTPS
jgi:hypothetical protein